VTWERGRDEVNRLVREGELKRVAPNRAIADRLLAEAAQHLDSSRLIALNDPAGAYQLGSGKLGLYR
jgi:hypothetical protein